MPKDNLPALRSSSSVSATMSSKQKLVFVGGLVVVGGFVLLPILVMLLKLVATTIALVVAGLGLTALVLAAPMLMRKWRNRVLIMMKNEARRNPIETLEQELLQRQEAYQQAGVAVQRIIALHGELTEQKDNMQARHGRTDPRNDQMVALLTRLIERLREKLRASAVALEEYQREVSWQRDRWEMAKRTGELATMLKAAGGGDVTDAFLADTAIGSIRSAFHNSMAEIDSILHGQEVAGLPLEFNLPPLVLPHEPALVAKG